ncbi:MAG: MerR family transcriptional regulator [Lachnospiraceae bacterium]|nr:MerR family transcriptional regulator [Lachnospiraceae bacterium]
MYTIGQVSQMFNIPISTLRYYDKEGFFPNLKRSSGIRRFGEQDIEALKVIECLKESGLELKDVKQFIRWATKGSSTYKNRKELFEKRKIAVEQEIKKLQKTLNILEYKCWYYDKAIKDGTEDKIYKMLPNKLPTRIQKLYNSFH